MGRPQHAHPFIAEHPSRMKVPMTRSGVNCIVGGSDFCLANLVNDQPTGIVGPNHRSAVFDWCVAVVRALCPIEVCVVPPRLQARAGSSRPVEGTSRNRLWFAIKADGVVTGASAPPVPEQRLTRVGGRARVDK